MSQDAASQFVGALLRSAELQKQLHELNLDLQANQTTLVETGAKAGYTFTFDDWTAVIERVGVRLEKASASASELSEQELEGVAGGAASGPCFCFVYLGWKYCIC
jgi:Nif11 domain